jgi:transposase
MWVMTRPSGRLNVAMQKRIEAAFRACVKKIGFMYKSLNLFEVRRVCSRAMNWITGTDRHQTQLLPAALEDYVTPENPVRFLDAFVARLDLRAAGFRFPKADPRGRGRPAYPPAELLKLYLYGYLHQLRSSRRLEAECARNLEVIWLVRQLRPDFKTIADFRKDNAAAFKAVVREFTRLCRHLDLFGGQLLAIDGTKIKASNAADRNWSQRQLEKHQAQLEAQLDEYLRALETADAQDAPAAAPSATELQEKMARLAERHSQIQERLQTLAQTGESQLSATDPDSRGMKSAHGHIVGYNVQGSVDAKHHLLVTVAATNAVVDQGQLATVAQAAKAELELPQADVVADGGYFKSEAIKACQEMGLEAHLPAVENSPSERAGLYGKADFRYDAQNDVYHCPNGSELRRRRQMEDKGRVLFHYDHPEACAGCPLKGRCTKAAYRTVSRWEHEAVLERMAAAVAAAPEKLAARKTLIEHPWGTLKWLLPGGFLVRGQVQVSAEVSLAHFGYNLKRALAVVGLDKLLTALQEWRPKPASAANQGGVATVAGKMSETIRGCQAIANSWRRRLDRLWQVSPATI